MNRFKYIHDYLKPVLDYGFKVGDIVRPCKDLLKTPWGNDYRDIEYGIVSKDKGNDMFSINWYMHGSVNWQFRGIADHIWSARCLDKK